MLREDNTTPRIASSQLRSDGLRIVFEDGEAATFPVSFLFAALGVARMLYEAEFEHRQDSELLAEIETPQQII